MPERVLTIEQASYLAELIRAVEGSKVMLYYPQGSESVSHPLKVTLRAFTNQDGTMYPHDADVRDAHIWASGIMEHWFKVSDLVDALINAITGKFGMDKPMTVIEAT